MMDLVLIDSFAIRSPRERSCIFNSLRIDIIYAYFFYNVKVGVQQKSRASRNNFAPERAFNPLRAIRYPSPGQMYRLFNCSMVLKPD